MREAKKGMAWYVSPDGRANTYPDTPENHKRLTEKGYRRTTPEDEARAKTPLPIEAPLPIVAPVPTQPVAPVPTQPVAPTIEITDGLAELGIKELRELAKALGIDPSQKRPDLENAIKAAKANG